MSPLCPGRKHAWPGSTKTRWCPARPGCPELMSSHPARAARPRAHAHRATYVLEGSLGLAKACKAGEFVWLPARSRTRPGSPAGGLMARFSRSRTSFTSRRPRDDAAARTELTWQGAVRSCHPGCRKACRCRALEEFMSAPSPLSAELARVPGTSCCGRGGKMGPTLARMSTRAPTTGVSVARSQNGLRDSWIPSSNALPATCSSAPHWSVCPVLRT